MTAIFFTGLTNTINAYLTLDPESTNRLKPLQGKCVAIELLPLHLHLYCTITDQGLTLSADEPIPPETTLRGTPLSLVGVALHQTKRQRFFADDVVIEGSTETGQQLIDLFDNMQIDWEEHLSRLIGDVPAYYTKRFFTRVAHWFSDTEDALTQNIRDYLQEEKNCLPPRSAVDDLFTDIDTLRMDIDRAEARIQELTKQLHSQDEGPL